MCKNKMLEAHTKEKFYWIRASVVEELKYILLEV